MFHLFKASRVNNKPFTVTALTVTMLRNNPLGGVYSPLDSTYIIQLCVITDNSGCRASGVERHKRNGKKCPYLLNKCASLLTAEGFTF